MARKNAKKDNSDNKLPEEKPETEPETEPEVEPEAEPEVEPEVEPEAKPEAISDINNGDQKPDKPDKAGKMKKFFDSIRLDDSIANFFVRNFNFEKIHPNTITTFGIFCNFAILFLVLTKRNILFKNIILFTVLFLRFLADCLDGAVARKYKKTSKIGHLLDTVSDIIFITIAIVTTILKYNLHQKLNLDIKHAITIILVLIFSFVRYYNISDSHNLIKEADTSNIIISFTVNNSYLGFLLYYTLISV